MRMQLQKSVAGQMSFHIFHAQFQEEFPQCPTRSKRGRGREGVGKWKLVSILIRLLLLSSLALCECILLLSATVCISFIYLRGLR